MTFDEFTSSGLSEWLAEVQKNGATQLNNAHLNYLPAPNIVVPSYVTAESGINVNRVKLHSIQKFEVCIPYDLSKPLPDTNLLEGVDSVEFIWNGEPLPEIFRGLKCHITTHQEHLQSLTSYESSGTITLPETVDNESVQELIKNRVKGFKFLCANAVNREQNDPVHHLQHAIFMADHFIRQVLLAKEDPAECIFFKINLNDDFYLNLATIRAIKQVWFNLLSHYGLPLSDPTIIAHTDDLSLSCDETEQNLIRACSMLLSAIAGGACVVSVRGLKDIERQNPGFGLRMNRNIQLLLREESFAAYVVDPAKGSYFIENLTRQLSEAAWNAFISGTLTSN